MNQNHPSLSFLDQLVSGNLDDTVSMVISSHTGSCKRCQDYMTKKEELLANDLFISMPEQVTNVPDFSNLQESIMNSAEDTMTTAELPKLDNILQFKNKKIDLPANLQNMKKHMTPWKSFGSISYSKIDVHGASNMYFVHFEPGVKISEHSHEGNEYAYVLAGSFQDQHNEYITGDFASFSHDDSHHPYTEDPDGCMLLVSIDGPFVFKEGWARLLNPFRNLFFKKL